MSETPKAAYERREAELQREVERLRTISRRLVSARTAVFLLGVLAVIVWDFLDGMGARVSLALAFALVIGFLVLVVVHRRVRANGRRHTILLALVRDGLHRLARDWDELPRWSEVPPVPEHPYAHDLDLLGRASLASLCGPVTTEPGRSTLAAWLLAPAAPAEIVERQAAVRELAPALDARLALAAIAGRIEPPTHESTQSLVGWAEEPARLLHVRWLAWARWVLPAALLVLAWLHLSGAAGPFWILPLLLQLIILRKLGPGVVEDFRRAEGVSGSLGIYADQITAIRAWSVTAPRLQNLLRQLGHEGVSSDERLRRLGKIVEFVESRRNGIFQLAGIFLLLDFHVQAALERWKVASGQRLRGWLDALGEVEALAALGCLAHDHPEWGFPIPAADPLLSAEALGHPLLRPDAAVPNDVQVGPAGTFLLVTGSNMSGKSTLLRAIGLNCVLGAAGAPVCARELRLPDVALHTSIRVQDSLEAGVSLFMAELLSLARIVQAARAAQGRGGTVFYLLDEVLQGTNSGDRRVAARTVLRHLLDAGAIGAATTHDLSLAAAPDLEARAHAVHFSETAISTPDGVRLSFDYRLKPGLATSRNALVLLEMVGLGPVEEPSPPV